jgi:carboxymethylenebutenolidase
MPSEAGGGAALAQQDREQQPLAQHPMATHLLSSDQGIDFDALQALPVASETRRPGILILPEMFGLNAPMQALADGWAARGHPALVPNVFWRSATPRGLAYDGADRELTWQRLRALDVDQAVLDLRIAVAALRAMPGCNGKVLAIGFCAGGLLAYLAAARCGGFGERGVNAAGVDAAGVNAAGVDTAAVNAAGVDTAAVNAAGVDTAGVNAAVAFYALGIARYLPDMAAIRCPLQLHYGLRDQHVPASEVAAVAQAMQAATPANARLELHRYDAGHSFFNNVRPGYDAAAAGLAAQRLDALLETL